MRIRQWYLTRALNQLIPKMEMKNIFCVSSITMRFGDYDINKSVRVVWTHNEPKASPTSAADWSNPGTKPSFRCVVVWVPQLVVLMLPFSYLKQKNKSGDQTTETPSGHVGHDEGPSTHWNSVFPFFSIATRPNQQLVMLTLGNGHNKWSAPRSALTPTDGGKTGKKHKGRVRRTGRQRGNVCGERTLGTDQENGRYKQ